MTQAQTALPVSINKSKEFAPQQMAEAPFFHVLLATAFFRCWHILLFFTGWASLITVLNKQGHGILIETILLTVLGTVLGFVLTYRTTASFERYNEGRKLWSQIITSSRTLAQLVWFHVPGQAGETPEEIQELKARALIEKKSVINLLEAFAVAAKHYLRGEDGIYYRDLYYLVKLLPAYALPAGIPSQTDLHSTEIDLLSPSSLQAVEEGTESSAEESDEIHHTHPLHPPFQQPKGKSPTHVSGKHAPCLDINESPRSTKGFLRAKQTRKIIFAAEEEYLFPASMPPKPTIFKLYPLSLLIPAICQSGCEVKSKKPQRIRAKMMSKNISHNLPLEILLYLSSYVARLQERGVCDVPTLTGLFASLDRLTESLSGLERILTTPVPFSYSIHLWVTTIVYCLALPLQTYELLGWVTIPATITVTFLYFGFLVAGEEIENPFGYYRNSLKLDHFTSNIIRNELKAVTSTPPPDPSQWAFSPENNMLFSGHIHDRVPPEEWVIRGASAIQASLSHSAF